ncbi:MAG: ABC transporter substrate-binding protein [Microvirga sp.]|jgi:branched-chain amino acid transport system substrate-binding protein|uniref:ABC transporter substrate-binding protein n=1 Tax=Microvirga tunisiensis TaxID=2108360 RepID=A0A5N7MDU4_9HYPH|nr:ABC transporter substrate-binding protein [Microvirga tunisiensis]MPR06687.1 ABC transporter substrate-binding protein [Microvirga tunisiensis]MPR24800.1 ABC transporter substrate-binding protein [Microvirga tunisiensis]
MKASKRILGAAIGAVLMGTVSAYADTIKVGIIGPFSGPFALQGKNFQAGVEAYMALNGKSVKGHDIEVIYRDLPAANPAQSRALAQELVVKEKVQYLGGVYFTPDAMAITPLLKQANTPLVIFNAATSAIMNQSPLVVRTSFTTAQTTSPLGKIAIDRGVKKVISAVSDYGPGVDAEAAFKKAFEAAGGQVVEAIRMPLNTNDFSPIMQRVRDSGAEAVFAFLPSGPTTLGFVKAYNETGLKQAGIKFFAPGDLTQESDLPALGDGALGLLTTFHYAVSHDSPENKKFVEAATKAVGGADQLSFPSVGAYDGMHVIYKMIEATDGKQDAQKAVDAVKGLSWTSPRGPVSIDAETRHITENIYLREVVKGPDGKTTNKEIQTFPNQKDPGLATQ